MVGVQEHTRPVAEIDLFFSCSFDLNLPYRTSNTSASMTAFASPLAIVGGVVILAALAVMRLLAAKPKGRLPPGPKGLPLVGNIMDLPPPDQPEHFHWLKLSKKHGPITSISVFGQTIVLLHDYAMTIELLEKRSNIYSERPASFFASEMCGWKPFVGLQGLNSLTRAYRRDIHGVVGTKQALVRVMPVEINESKRFLVRAMRQPDEWEDHIKKYTATVILNIAYGYNAAQNGPDPLVDLVEAAMAEFSDSLTPGKWMVDVFNWLQYLPGWFPGAGFKKTAEKYSKITWDSSAVPLQFTESRIEEGRATPCMITDLLDKVDRKTLSQAEHERIMRSAGALYLGGADTVSKLVRVFSGCSANIVQTLATLKWFFLTMVKHPEAQRKAQEEIDRVLGVGRIPDFEDRERLPYTDAIWQEVMRWNTIGHLGLPHAALEDGEYNGYFIPKGSMLLAHTG